MIGLKESRTLRQIKTFLGLYNVFYRFSPISTLIDAPKNRKIRKAEPTEYGPLNEEERNALERLREKLVPPPVLALPRFAVKYTVDTDDYDKQVGFVLLQEQKEGTNWKIGYWYRSPNQSESPYKTTNSDYLAVLWATLLLGPYLNEIRFKIRTEHDTIRCILNMADETRKMER